MILQTFSKLLLPTWFSRNPEPMWQSCVVSKYAFNHRKMNRWQESSKNMLQKYILVNYLAKEEN